MRHSVVLFRLYRWRCRQFVACSVSLLSSGTDRATIAVAHRLSTSRNANEILAMVDGAIVERGTHDGLIESSGVYASQWNIQTGDVSTY